MADEIRVSEVSTAELMSSPTVSSSGPASVRGWAGEVEVEDRWGISSMSTRSEGCAPHDQHHRFDLLRQSRSRRLHGSRRSLHRAGRRFFLCFRRSTINLAVADLEPPTTPPKSGTLNMSGPLTNMGGPFTTPRSSAERTSGPQRLQRVSGPQTSGPISTPRLNGNFMDEAIDTTRTKNEEVEEPTSPVVNCMGHVKNKKATKNVKKQECNEMDRFRRTKSQAPSSSPKLHHKFSSCKWIQLLRSNSSSISPSTPVHSQPCGEGEIDLGRFSSVSGASDPSAAAAASLELPLPEKRPDKTCLLMQRHQQQQQSSTDTENKRPDKTCLLMQRHQQQQQSSTDSENKRPDKTCLLMQRQQQTIDPEPEQRPEKSWRSLRDNDDTDELLQAQLDGDAEFRRIVADSEPVFRNLPKLKTKRTEAPKWLADEPALNRRQGSVLYNKKMSRSSTTTAT